MSAGRDVKELEKAIGYSFRDPGLLPAALTHSSYANEMKGKIPGIRSNERLEFLGDAILEEIVTRYLYSEYPDDGEGERMRGDACRRVAVDRTRRVPGPRARGGDAGKPRARFDPCRRA